MPGAVPAPLTTKMPSVTPLPDASALSWKNDQGMVILKQLILVDESLPFDIFSDICTKTVYNFLNSLFTCVPDVLHCWATAVKGRGTPGKVLLHPQPPRILFSVF